MKKIILVLALFAVKTLSAQNFKINYEETHSIDDQLEQINKIPDAKMREQIKQQLLKPTYYELLFKPKEKVSIYKETNDKENEKNIPEAEKGSNVQIKVVKNGSSGIFHNYKTDEYFSGESFFGKDFYVADKITKIDWVISTQTKKIGNFNCKKATATYREKEVEAWFCEDFPIAVGPSVFSGLPGLIVQLSHNGTIFNALSVENVKQISVEKPEQKGKVVTKAEFQKIVSERM